MDDLVGSREGLVGCRTANMCEKVCVGRDLMRIGRSREERYLWKRPSGYRLGWKQPRIHTAALLRC
jgi:hypothetical protein